MLLTFMKSKIHRATITGCNLNYEGSISIDPVLLEKAKIFPYEQVHVLNINNGNRIITYAIPAADDEVGKICLNGAGARMAQPGDLVIIITYASFDIEYYDPYMYKEATNPIVVHVNKHNIAKK